jgi:hypothetical protein
MGRSAAAGRAKLVSLLLLSSACDCGGSGPLDATPTTDSSFDARHDAISSDGSPADGGRFADADELSCPEIALRYFSFIDDFLMERQSCSADAECAFVGLSVRCKDGHNDIGGCGTAVAVEHQMSFLDDVRALQGELCEVRTTSCVASSACPEVVTVCDAGRCVVR